MRLPLCLLVALATAACSPPVQAPAELGELTLYLYQNFGSETGEELVAGAASLEAYLLTVDMAADKEDRAVTLPVLTEAYQGGVAAPEGAVAEDQVPVAVSFLSTNGPDAHLGLMTEPNQVCIAADGYVWYERQFDTDAACFEGATCDEMSVTNTMRYESILASAWLQEQADYRAFELEDGRRVVMKRGWSDQRYLSDNESASWDQRFGLDTWIPDTATGGTFRFHAFWSQAELPGISDDVYANLVRDGLDEGFENEDTFLAGGECDNDRNAEYEPPF